jgi:hypothetical protein
MIGRGTRSNVKDAKGALFAPLRNRFFHGKKLDAYHFELETAYGIGMRRLINRLVIGRGVVCGLDVTPGERRASVEIGPGLAIDGWGREIVVAAPSQPIAIPQAVIDRTCTKLDERDPNDRTRYEDDDCQPGWLTVVICYHECEVGPVSTSNGSCGPLLSSEAGSIRESWRVEFVPGRAEVTKRLTSGLIHERGTLSPPDLARTVTRGCCDPDCDACIPLAVIELNCDDRVVEIAEEQIDTQVRPVVITNPLIYGVGCGIEGPEPNARARAR